MVANLEMLANGQAAMAYAGDTPWHGLGQVLKGDESPEEIRKMAGLDWEVGTVPVYRYVGDKLVECKMGRASVRLSDDSELGAVGPRWTAYQNDAMFECFMPFVKNGLMSWNTAGSLRDGQRVWCLCQLNLDNCEIAKGDEIRKWALLSNGHDGKLAVRLGFTPVRAVCENTLSMAHSSKASQLIRVRHNRMVKTNVEALRDIMNLANQEFETSCDNFRLLASKSINKADLNKYVKLVFGVQNKSVDEISTRQKNINEDIVRLFETGRGHELAGGTWWGAYNAFTEYASWEKGRNNENRMTSVWFGQGQTFIKKALDTALALCA